MKKIVVFVTVLLVGFLFLNSFVLAGNIDNKEIFNNSPPEAPDIEGPNSKSLGFQLYPPGEPQNFTFKAKDPDGHDLFYFIDWQDGSYTDWIGPYKSEEKITKSHNYSEKGTFLVRAKAKDIYGLEGPWGTIKIPVRILKESHKSSNIPTNKIGKKVTKYVQNNKDIFSNSPPEKPTITGPWLFKAGEPYECKIYTVDPDGDNVSYQVDWDDGDMSNWTDWFQSGEEITQSHYYSEEGEFLIKARAKDVHGQVGPWGVIHFGVSQENKEVFSNSPLDQSSLNNPLEIWIGVEYTFNTTIIDPEGDDVFFFIDWGDGTSSGWMGPFSSGSTIYFTHYWTEKGTYHIRIRSRDEYGQETEWQEFTIKIIPPPRLFMNMEFNGMLKTRPWKGLILSLIYFDKVTVTKGISQNLNLEPFTCHDYKFVALALNKDSNNRERLYIDASSPLMILIGY